MTNVWPPPMNASDVMTRNVLSIGPEAPTREVARLLLDKSISAVPVIDGAGVVIGIISESDLVPPEINRRAPSRLWWLEMLADGEDLATEFLDYVRAGDRPVREIMTAPVVAVAVEMPLPAIAEILPRARHQKVPSWCAIGGLSES
jgi:CBS domain-containing protein